MSRGPQQSVAFVLPVVLLGVVSFLMYLLEKYEEHSPVHIKAYS